MNRSAPHCRICHVERAPGEPWFLVVGNDWEDRLKILCWNETLARQDRVHPACSPSHVQQLVAYWMATGSLNYPFATDASLEGGEKVGPRAHPLASPIPNTDNTQAIGELAVDRASVKRLLLENPESLVPVLDALMTALCEKSPAPMSLSL